MDNKDYDDLYNDAGYADSLTDFGFFVFALMLCFALVGIIFMIVH